MKKLPHIVGDCLKKAWVGSTEKLPRSWRIFSQATYTLTLASLVQVVLVEAMGDFADTARAGMVVGGLVSAILLVLGYFNTEE